MAKDKNNKMYWVIGIILLLIIGFNQGWFKDIFGKNVTPITPTPEKVVEFQTYNVLLSFSPNPMCAGSSMTGSLDTNIPNGECTLFYMGEGWTPYATFDLNANGDVSASRVIAVAGTVQFQAVCCDAQGNCKISNTVSLTVRICDTDGDGIPDNTDPDDDNDGFSDEEEIAAGTNPLDPNSHPGGVSDPCPVYCRGLGSYSGGRFVTSPGYCTAPEISKVLPPGYCCCMPVQQQTTYTCGNDADTSCSGSCPTSYSCAQIESETNKWCACLSGSTVHPDWKPGATYYNPTPIDVGPEPVVCSDTDLGITGIYSVLTKGTCTDATGTHEDSTAGGVLTEYWCQDNQCGSSSYICADWFPGGSGPVGFGECLTQTDYYSTNAYYYVSWDSLTGGAPIRHANGRFGTWTFVSGGGGGGYGLPYTLLRLTVSNGGSGTITLPINGHTLINVDEFLSGYEGKTITVRFDSITSNGAVYDTTLRGTVNFAK